MKFALNWLDERTGYRGIVNAMLFENVPGGARWRYAWGSTLVFTFVVQMITGFFLWMNYSPSAQTAWESVYYIQHEMTAGWLVRGIHHFTAHAMIVLLALHMMQIIIDGAYRAPREVNFWIGLILLQIVLALGLTGYLLPWDQKGYWATKVATNIMGAIPIIGPAMQRVVIGGADYGHHTLTRFFALHAGLLPAMMIAFIGLHVYVFRRHGLKHKEPKKKEDASFWPDQVLCDAVACLGVFVVVMVLVLQDWFLSGFSPDAALGAPLAAPADPSEPYAAARPEWYFLFLFQFLKYFPGESEIYGSVVIPGAVMTVLFLMPFVGKWKLGHAFNVAYFFTILIGVAGLTYLALAEDASKDEYKLAVAEAERNAERVVTLAQSPRGIPPTGAVTLLREDPYTQGPRLFARNCAMCHRYDGHDGLGGVSDEAPTAADLKGFADREWLTGFFDPEKIKTPQFFGGTKFADGQMAKFVTKDVADYSDEEKEILRKVILALSAEAKLPGQRELDERDKADIAEGRQLLIDDELFCFDCHAYYKHSDDGKGPDLTGYGSEDWLVEFIRDPGHDRFYGKANDENGMPAFGTKGIMDDNEIRLVARWLRGDWYEPGHDAGTLVAEPAGATVAQEGDTPEEPKPEPEPPKVDTDPTPTPGTTQAGDTPPAPAKTTKSSAPKAPPAGPAEVPDVVDFVKHVKPILDARCIKCHAPPKPKGGYKLDMRASAVKAGSSGDPGVIPGASADSLFFQRITTDDPDEIMPPKGDPLTAVQIAVLKKWIDAGADWPDEVILEAPPKE